MRFINLEQNTPEWLEFRRNKIGASDAPAIMGVSPYKTAYELYLEKIHSVEQKANSAMQEGKRSEDPARKAFEAHMGVIVSPCVVQHDIYDWMIASLDGMDFDCTLFVELKRANKLDHEMALDGVIPEKYFPQVQHQIEISPLDFGYYGSFNPENTKNPFALVTQKIDPKYVLDMIEKEKAFYECLQNKTPPPLTQRDLDKMAKKDVILLEDEDSVSIAEHIRKARVEGKRWADEEEKWKERFIQKGFGSNLLCNGVRLSLEKREGSIDYKKVPELKNLNLEQYRKPPTQYWKISLV